MPGEASVGDLEDAISTKYPVKSGKRSADRHCDLRTPLEMWSLGESSRYRTPLDQYFRSEQGS